MFIFSSYGWSLENWMSQVTVLWRSLREACSSLRWCSQRRTISGSLWLLFVTCIHPVVCLDSLVGLWRYMSLLMTTLSLTILYIIASLASLRRSWRLIQSNSLIMSVTLILFVSVSLGGISLYKISFVKHT